MRIAERRVANSHRNLRCDEEAADGSREVLAELGIIHSAVPGRDDIGSLPAHPETDLVQQRGRQCGGKCRRQDHWTSEVLIAEHARKGCNHVVRIDTFVGEVNVSFVIRRKVVVDLHIELFAESRRLAAAEKIVQAVEVPQNSVSRKVQAIADLIIVRRGVEPQRPADKARRIELNAMGIPSAAGTRSGTNSDSVRHERRHVDRGIRAIRLRGVALERPEDADVLQGRVVGRAARVRCGAVRQHCWSRGTAIRVDCRTRRVGSCCGCCAEDPAGSVIPSVEIPEDAQT